LLLSTPGPIFSDGPIFQDACLQSSSIHVISSFLSMPIYLKAVPHPIIYFPPKLLYLIPS
jgi:hypothetical protein